MCIKCLLVLLSAVMLDSPSRPVVTTTGLEATVTVDSGRVLYAWGNELHGPMTLTGRRDLMTDQFELYVEARDVRGQATVRARVTDNINRYLATQAITAQPGTTNIPTDPNVGLYASVLQRWEELRVAGADSPSMRTAIQQRLGPRGQVATATPTQISVKLPGERYVRSFAVRTPPAVSTADLMVSRLQTIADALHDGDMVVLASDGNILFVSQRHAVQFQQALVALRQGRPAIEWQARIRPPFDADLRQPKSLPTP